MNMDDAAARIIRGHWRVLVVGVLLPVLLVLVTDLGPWTHSAYRSTERIKLGSVAAASNVQADAVTTGASALATSPSLVQAALSAAKVHRDVRVLVQDRISVVRVGLSDVVDLSVTDQDRHVAQTLTASLGQAMITFLDGAGRQPEADALRAIDQQTADLAKERDGLLAAAKLDPPPATPLVGTQPSQLDQALSELATERGRLTLQRLTALDGQIQDLAAQRGRLTLQQASRTSPAVVDAASLPGRPVSSGLAQTLELAVLLGLLLGLAAAGALELLRPSVPSARSLARLLRTPLLGELAPAGDGAPAELLELAERVALTARRQELDAVVVVPAGAVPAELGERVAAAAGGLARSTPVPVQEPVGVGRGSSAHRATAGGRALSSHVCGPPGGSAPGYGVLDGLLRAEGRRAGVVLLAPGRLPVAALDDARDLLEATGWPLLGVVTTSGRLS